MKQVFFGTPLHAGQYFSEPESAAILELAVSGQQKTAIQIGSGVVRVFMVAGARNRRYLHLDFASV